MQTQRLRALSALEPPKPEALPHIELYMDQVLSLVNGFLAQTGETGMTKAMINNYSKAEVIPRPQRKRYTPDHVMAILLAHCLKQTVSLEDSKRLLENAGETAQAYRFYSDALQTALTQAGRVEENLAQRPNDSALIARLALAASAQAHAGKLLCESLLALLPETAKKNEKNEKNEKMEKKESKKENKK